MDFLYTFLIFPIEQIIELMFAFIFRILDSSGFPSYGYSIIGLSVAISTLILPLYMLAEKQQQAEREKQGQMKRMKDNIKSVFKGSKRYMMLSTLYRQHNYHPIYALRSSFGLLIQIPFFIAAWHFLANLEMLKGQKFKFVGDLSTPDGILWGINLLPILMTLINVVSGFIYTKELEIKDKIQVHGIAALFLILLYNSPSALVLYWTCNNIYNLVKNILVKNILVKTRNADIWIKVLILFTGCNLTLYLLLVNDKSLMKRLFFIVLVFATFLLFYFRKSVAILLQKKLLSSAISEIKHEKIGISVLFILSLTILFLLNGLFIPSSLISSSVEEFSYIEYSINNPFNFIFNTTFQSFGIFILYPLFVFYISSMKAKEILIFLACNFAFISIVNVFIFPPEYGSLTLLFTFSKNVSSSGSAIFINLFATQIILIIFLILFFYRLKKILFSILLIFNFALLLISIGNNINIYNKYQTFLQQKKNQTITNEKIYHFSKTGKNVLIIMLDRAISGYVPYILKEKPELHNSFDGFTFYKNTISFAPCTIFATPALFGGYEYTPLEMQARKDTLLVSKHNEALLLLPKIFLDHGYNVTVTDPPLPNHTWTQDLSCFDKYPNINAQSIIGKHNEKYLSNKKEISLISASELIKSNLIRFSIFRSAPLLFRNFIYNNGEWLKIKKPIKEEKIDHTLKIDHTFLSNYIHLDNLPNTTTITKKYENNYIVLTNYLTHEYTNSLQAPDYILSHEINNKDYGSFANYIPYQVNIAAFLLLGKWFDLLKENNVYNNTRIIIVSDHGVNLYLQPSGSIQLPNTNYTLDMISSLLLVKDFNSYGELSINNSFMTTADVPHIALADVVENPINPWTGNNLRTEKENGATITTSILHNPDMHTKYLFNIKQDEWLHVHTNIFDQANWSVVNVKK